MLSYTQYINYPLCAFVSLDLSMLAVTIGHACSSFYFTCFKFIPFLHFHCTSIYILQKFQFRNTCITTWNYNEFYLPCTDFPVGYGVLLGFWCMYFWWGRISWAAPWKFMCFRMKENLHVPLQSIAIAIDPTPSIWGKNCEPSE